MTYQQKGFAIKASVLAVVLGLAAAGTMSPTSHAESTVFSTVAIQQDGRIWVGPPNDLEALPLPAAAGDVSVSGSGDRIAVAVGLPIRTYMEGVRGQVHVLDAATGALLESTSLAPSVITGVAIDATGGRVAFVKDYGELWLLDVGTGAVTRLADIATVAPGVEGSAIFDPAFASSGQEVVFGVVEETFHGEDDRLDNLWSVGIGDGALEPERLTSFEAPETADGWTILRSPVVSPGGRTLVGSATDNVWSVVDVTDGIDPIGPVPPGTVPIGATDEEMLFLSMNMTTLKFNVVVLELPVGGGPWQHWCEHGCTTIARNVSAASAAAVP